MNSIRVIDNSGICNKHQFSPVSVLTAEIEESLRDPNFDVRGDFSTLVWDPRKGDKNRLCK